MDRHHLIAGWDQVSEKALPRTDLALLRIFVIDTNIAVLLSHNLEQSNRISVYPAYLIFVVLSKSSRIKVKSSEKRFDNHGTTTRNNVLQKPESEVQE